MAGERRRYRSFVSDSSRWDGFELRPDDIVISTPPKCGTTWTQMLCALLVFDTVELPRPLTELSPWLDMQTHALDDVVALLEAQEHRRFIKTHTPLDGLPREEGVTYLCVGRDPRDVSLSWQHHLVNMDFDAVFAARAAAVGLDDLAELGPPPPPPPEDPLERFWAWADAEPSPTVGVTLAGVLHHLRTFWDERDDPRIALFHYSDLLADLPGQLRRLADVLGIAVAAERVEELAAAATFERMRDGADHLAPDVGNGIWRSNRDFFHQGGAGRWRELLGEDDLRRYETRVAALVSPDLARWAHVGWLGSESATTSLAAP